MGRFLQCWILKMRPNLGRKNLGELLHPRRCGRPPHTAKGRNLRPLGVSYPCLPYLRRAGPVKAQPAAALADDGWLVEDCVSNLPALTGHDPVEYPPRRGKTPRFSVLYLLTLIGLFLSNLSCRAAHIAPAVLLRCNGFVNRAADLLTHILDIGEGLPDLRCCPTAI